MLRRAKAREVRERMDEVWALARDFRTSSFPTYLDGIKTKEDFEQTALDSFEDPDDEILLFFHDDDFEGWIQYYRLPADRYVGFECFDIREHVEDAIDEFLDHVKDSCRGFQIDFGFPAGNERACRHLEQIGFVPVEHSSVFVLPLEDWREKEETAEIVPVTAENFDAFRQLHDGVPDMFWNSERLQRELQAEETGWHMFLLNGETGTRGAAYYVEGPPAEIFGADFPGCRVDGEALELLLIRILNDAKRRGQRHLIWFAGEEERETAVKTGMTFIADYVLYWNAE